jgi:uncharacterized membrane protein YbhN (UPF0104 family)
MRRWLSVHHVERDVRQIIGLILLAALLYCAAGVGMAFVAGFGAVQHRLASAHWWWLAPSFAAVLVAFVGYFFAYRGIARAEGGPEIETSSLLAVVTAGFGGFLAQGGTALDDFAMRAGGAEAREAKVRVSALAGFEHGVLAIIVCPAAIVAVVLGLDIPKPDFTWPWAVIPPLGFGFAMWAAERYRERLRERKGWRGRLGVFLDAVHVVYENLRNPRAHWSSVLGMGLYWGGDMFALWAATSAFGFQMSALSVIVALGTGMVFTRRTGPLGGAGIMMVALVATLWYGVRAPFAAATLGVAAYRFFTLWVPLPASLAALPKLRALGRQGEDSSGRGTRADEGEPALQH